jgi:hypothetical protein
MDARTPRLTARLFTVGRVTVEVPDVPLPPPATGGKLTVAIPYPAGETARTVHRVAVINQDSGFIARSSILPRVVEPGDTLTVEFGEEHISLNRALFDEDPAESVGGERNTMPYDLQAAVTSWVAQELQERVPDESIGYWVILDRGASYPHGVIYLQATEFSASERVSIPLEEAHVRSAVRRAVDKLARLCTERDQADEGGF